MILFGAKYEQVLLRGICFWREMPEIANALIAPAKAPLQSPLQRPGDPLTNPSPNP